ncbi:MAG: PAS domain S-box protein [Pseudomonadota bacterium]
MDAAAGLFSTQNFMPHGHCYLWLPHILWTHVLSDALTGIAYFSIPAALFYFARKRPDLGLNKVLYLFVAFIVLCGMTHFMAIYTIWEPAYFQFGILKALTALVSVATAIALWPLLPKLIATPTLAQLEEAHANLLVEVEARKKSEAALAQRNVELKQFNNSLESMISALKTSEEGLALAQKTAKLGSWEWHVQEDRLVWSAELHRIFGTDPETFDATFDGFMERVHPDDRNKVDEAVRQTFEEGEAFDIDYRILPSQDNDEMIVGNARGEVVKDSAGRPVLFSGTLLDITERKQSEGELEDSRTFLSTILENVQDGIVACNENGELTLFNKAARKFHGMDASPIGADQWTDAYDLYEADGKTPLPQSKIPLHKAFNGEMVEEQEMVIAPHNLPARILIARASPLYNQNHKKIGAVATMHDVTLERAREEELRRRQNELELIFDSVPVRIWYKDDKNRIIRLNQYAAESMGLTVVDAEGADTYELFPEMAKKYHDDDLEVIESGAPKYGIVEEYTPKDGPGGWVSTDKVPYIDPKTGERFVFVASTDITELKEAQEELRRSNAELEQFARVTSHDLQEPLRKLMIFSEFLEQDLGGDMPEKAKEDLDSITDAARRMQRLIKDILALSRMRTDRKLQRVNPHDCVTDAMATWAMQCKERGAIVVYDDLPEVMADPGVLTQVYSNLIGNALKFVEEDRPPKIKLTAELTDKDVILGVADNGIGIPQDSHEKIFQPLARLHGREKYEGTGIGLAICKKGVEQLGGRIWVESAPGAGAHFRFSLRRAKAARSAA